MKFVFHLFFLGILLVSCHVNPKIVDMSLPRLIWGTWNPESRGSGNIQIVVSSNQILWGHDRFMDFEVIDINDYFPFDKKYFKNEFSEIPLLSKQYVLQPKNISNKTFYTVHLEGGIRFNGQNIIHSSNREPLILCIAYADFDNKNEYFARKVIFKKEWSTMGFSRK